MITTLETDLLKELASHRNEPCVTIYIPTHVKGREIEQDPIRLKNAISKAEDELAKAGADDSMRHALLDRIRRRVDDRDFWRHQGSALAIFASTDIYEEVRLRAPVDERVRVSDRFLITPLVESTGEHSVHVLALSRGNARLFQLGEHGGSELELPEGTPRSIEDANWFIDRESQLQDRAKTTGGEFHGHGDTGGTERADLRRFLRELSDGVKVVVGDNPVIVAAVTELAAAYQHDAHHRVSQHIVAGNPDNLDLTELRERAAGVIEASRSEKMNELEHRWNESLGTKTATKGIIDTVIAAHHGRVETLLVGDTTPIWGTFDPDEVEVVIYDERGDDHRNLVDDAIRATLEHGGKIVKVREIESEIGSLLRY